MDSLSLSRKSWLRDATIDLWLKAEKPSQLEIYEAAMAFLREQRKDVVAEMRKLADKHPEWKDDPEAALRIVNVIYDPREWDEDLRAAMGPAIARVVVRGYLSAKAVQAGRRRRFPPVWRKGGDKGQLSASAMRVSPGDGHLDGKPPCAQLSFVKRREEDPPAPGSSGRRPPPEQPDWADSPLSEDELREVLSFELPPSVTRRVFDTVGKVMDKPYWKDVNDTERERMRWSIHDGIKEGKTLDQIAKDIKGDIGSDDVRARRIATTETTGALNAGGQVQGEEAEDVGVKLMKVWTSIGDDKVRETHEEADGQVVEGADGLFTVGGYQTPYPGHVDLPAEERISCRCVAIYEPAIAEEKSAYIRRGKLFIDRDYAELARQERLAGLFEAKHGDHDQSSHGSRGGSDPAALASTLSDSGDLYSGAADDYRSTLADAASSSDPDAAEKAAYEAYEGFKTDVREKLDDFRDSVTDAGIDAYGQDFDGDTDELDKQVAEIYDSLETAAADLVDMPGEIARGQLDAGEMNEAVERLGEAVAGVDDRLYEVARGYLETGGGKGNE